MSIGPSIHPGLLLHWTGKDIDKKFEDDFYQKDHSRTSENNELKDMYIDRLLNILKYGLCMKWGR